MADRVPVLTYSQLGELLLSSGFSTYVLEDGARVYKHQETGALLAFPVLPELVHVLPRHYIGTRMVLDAFGIMEPDEFDARVRQAA